MSEAITSGLPTLKKFELINGQAAASGIVAAELIRLMETLAFEVKGRMIEAAADAILARYSDVNTADLKLFRLMVQRAEIGGKLYRMDSRTLVELFAEYYDRRQYEAEIIIAEKQKAWMGDLRTNLPSTEKINNMYEAMKKERHEKPKPPPVDTAAFVAGLDWINCKHEFEDKGDYKECLKCRNIIY